MSFRQLRHWQLTTSEPKPLAKSMASEEVSDARAILDLSFQSLASRHMDLKQVELDTAAAKVDELSKQLESLWTGSPGQSGVPQKGDRPSISPWLTQDTPVWTVPTAASLLHQSPWKSASLDSPESYSSSISENSASLSPGAPYGSSPNQLLPTQSTLGRPTSPRPSIFLQSELDRTSSPRPKVLPVPYESVAGSMGHASSPRFLRSAGSLERQYDYKPYTGPMGRAGSPRQPTEGSESLMFFPDRAPSPRPPMPPPYENHSMYPSVPGAFPLFRAQDDLVIRRRSQKGWNESDLDVAYEKKPSHPASYERGDPHGGHRQSGAGLPLAPWRESSLDGGGVGQGKEEHYGMHSATLPRNYKVSPLASERRSESSFRRFLPANQTGTLPRNWQFGQQPISRIPMPPPSPQGSRPKRHKPLPLSMIFRLQNAFWEHGASGTKLPFSQAPLGSPLFLRSLQKQMPQQPLTPAQPHLRMAQSGSEGNSRAPPFEVPAEPVRVVPITLLTGEMEPELESLLPGSEPAEVDEVARPLSPTRLQPVLPPEAQKVPEFEEVARILAEMPRPLKRRGSMEQCPSVALPPTHKKQYQQIISRLFHHHPRKEEAVLMGEAAPQTDLVPIIEASEQKVPGTSVVPALAPPPRSPPSAMPVPSIPDMLEGPATISPVHSPEKRSALRKVSSPRKRLKPRARLNPLVLLLDAALTGELDVVKEAVAELNDSSQPNDEGITALHNAICGANYNIVDFLINIGANVNSPDSHGWTPLHCAASCNDTAICIALVKHGAAIFATTCSDGSMAIEKCDPYRDGYSECFSYLADVEQNMGLMNNGVVYALWDYSAEFSDELSFHEGQPVTVLRRDGQEETDWWWASLYGQEGYVPKNYFGLFPRVRPQQKKA
ncbi:relA-associated inhibitor isoform X1 [Sphaerodactylus townsendi]|uniref:relA-associated inhibitor isoform X1 n=3 Tax=Sphaerodactylus townsendi TaxID=933632 RepID=UPI0020264ABA|nr:relA-associated inhibitor isoform X1 [Sphaerodactylus townsendi]